MAIKLLSPSHTAKLDNLIAVKKPQWLEYDTFYFSALKQKLSIYDR